MENGYCPNLLSCKLVTTINVVGDKVLRDLYVMDYCKSTYQHWKECKRFITKNHIHFCPDFVLPDTRLSIDEIIDKFDNENNDQ